MTGNDLLSAVGAADDADLLLAEGQTKAKAGRWRYAVMAAAAAVVLGVGIFAAGRLMKKPQGDPSALLPTDAANDAATVEQTESLTEAPTEAITPAPTEDWSEHLFHGAAAAYLPEVPHEYCSSEYSEYIRTLWNEAYKAGDGLGGFFNDTAKQFLLMGEKDENTAYSPLNVYFALAMLAETASGETREQVLGLLRAPDMDSLRRQADLIWLANYQDNDRVVSLPAASLWLNSAYCERINGDLVSRLAEKHHASVFEGDMADGAFSQKYREWLNEQTRGLLEEYVEDKAFNPSDLMRIAATLYYKAGWQEEFNAERSFPMDFHSPSGDESVTFMEGLGDDYYRGVNYVMANKGLNGGGAMWFVLPDEGVTLEHIIEDGDALTVMELALNGQEGLLDQSSIVRLYLPRFDVSSELDLVKGLCELGVTDCFDPSAADFSGLTDMEGVYVSNVVHSVRVTAEESGVEAAAITEITYANGAHFGEPVDVMLDRPFMFIITGADGTPLFMGAVYHPGK